MLRRPYLIFMGDIKGAPNTKTAFGICDWLPDDAIGQHRLPGSDVDLGLPEMTATEAAARGARSLLIGVAPVGGILPASWIPSLVAALEAGLDIVSGLHTRLIDMPAVKDAAAAMGRSLHDVRIPTQVYPVGNGRKRSGKRLLTVGTDCAVGKKYAALALSRALSDRGVAVDFRATGQTGIMIAGSGIPIDAIVADFLAGAAEALSPAAAADHWDVIEGQGCLFHPAYAGVTLGLLHGSQPDALVLCHDPLRKTLNGFPEFAVPGIAMAIQRYVEAARLTNPAVTFVGISLNTSGLAPSAADSLLGEMALLHGLPCFDPLRSDLGPVVARVLAP